MNDILHLIPSVSELRISLDNQQKWVAAAKMQFANKAERQAIDIYDDLGRKHWSNQHPSDRSIKHLIRDIKDLITNLNKM